MRALSVATCHRSAQVQKKLRRLDKWITWWSSAQKWKSVYKFFATGIYKWKAGDTFTSCNVGTSCFYWLQSSLKHNLCHTLIWKQSAVELGLSVCVCEWFDVWIVSVLRNYLSTEKSWNPTNGFRSSKSKYTDYLLSIAAAFSPFLHQWILIKRTSFHDIFSAPFSLLNRVSDYKLCWLKSKLCVCG